MGILGPLAAFCFHVLCVALTAAGRGFMLSGQHLSYCVLFRERTRLPWEKTLFVNCDEPTTSHSVREDPKCIRSM